MARSSDGGRLDVAPRRERGDGDEPAPRRRRPADTGPDGAAARQKAKPAEPRARREAPAARASAEAQATRRLRPAEPSRDAPANRTSDEPRTAKRPRRPAEERPSSRAAEDPRPAKRARPAATREPDTGRAPGTGRLVRRAADADDAAPGRRTATKPSGRKGGTRGRRTRRRRSLLGRTVVFLWRTTVTLSLLAFVAVAAIISYYAATLPPRAEWAVPARPPNVAIVSENGELIANRGDTGGRAVRLEDLPEHVPQAVVAIEDRRFYSHPGLDPIGLARAMVANVRAGRLVQGGSTLTQQLAKNLFLSPSRTLERKIQEMILAVWLEIQYDKDEILEMYLNRVYLGAGATGVDGAARRYFGKPAEELELAEAAMIAGLLRAPSYYAPTTDLERARERAATVLRAMREAGFIDAIQETYARQRPAELGEAPVALSGGYVADWVNEVLPGFSGNLTEDIVVETTINLELQELAQSALQEIIARDGAEKGVSEGSVVVLDGSGAVKALVGGKSYQGSQYNRAISALRQPGSAFKPFVYLAALEYGLTPQSMRIDQPTRIGDWSPENYTRRYYGPVTLERALAHSLNTIAAQLTAEVGPSAVASVARRLGVRSEMQPNASIALGTSEVTLLELTTAYVPFSNGGVGVVPHVVRRIRTADGELLYERRGGGPGQVVDIAHVGAMNQMLAAALADGTAARARLADWQAAGKTGTSQNWRDAWFVGYTAFFTAGVWLGNDDNSPTERATGGSLPADLWKLLMEKVHEGMVPADLPGVEMLPAVVAADRAPVDDPWNAPRTAADGPPGARDPRDWITPAPQREGDGIGGFLGRLFGGG